MTAGDGHQAVEFLRAIANVAAPTAVHTTDWGHSGASFWLQNSGAGEKDLECSDEQLLRAAAFCAAEFQISRKFELRSAGQVLLMVLIDTITQLTGRRQGRHLGLISFIYEATSFNGAMYGGAFATHHGWRLYPGASPRR